MWRLRTFCAFAALGDAAEVADQADERPAIGAGISFRGPLLAAAGAAGHRIVLVKFGHGVQEVRLYRLILLINVAREMPSSMAARVRFPV